MSGARIHPRSFPGGKNTLGDHSNDTEASDHALARWQ